MNKAKFFAFVIICILSSCVDYDESTYVTDDAGMVHHTKHYLRDKRGQREFPPQIENTGRKKFIFDPKIPAFAAYDETGKRVLTGSASGGMNYCDDIKKPCRTITGNFKVYAKRDENCKSREYPLNTESGSSGGARMPYCMYFYRGFTIHAGYEVPTHNTSHGCIRVLPSAAKWLNEEFIDIGTEVIVMSYDDDDSPLT